MIRPPLPPNHPRPTYPAMGLVYVAVAGLAIWRFGFWWGLGLFWGVILLHTVVLGVRDGLRQVRNEK